MDAHPYIALALSLVACFSAAAIGSVFTLPSIKTWYAQIRKPSWQPPNSLFGPVWTVLYIMMAIAAWLVWLERGRREGVTLALTAFAIQLVLNAAWSIIFFGKHRIAAALVDIVLLWLAIAATIVLFWSISQTAAWLMVPYFAWVTFATALNGTIWRLNAAASH